MGKLKTLFSLVKRNIKLFTRDKLTMFLSLLGSLIILLLFVLFLKQVQLDGIKSFFEQFNVVGVNSKYINGLVNGWFLSGVMAVSLISVGLTFYAIMIRDVELNISCDFLSSPTSKNLIKFSYFLASFIINVLMNLIILAIGLIYLAIAGTFFIGFVDILLLLVNIILSALSASVIMLLIGSLFKNESQFGAFTGILSSMSGFVIGAYMPISTFPMAIQYVVGFVPGSYSANIFRNIFIQPVIDKMSGVGDGAIKAITEYFGLNVNFCGVNIGYGMSFLFLGVSVLLFGLIAYFVFKYGKKKTVFNHKKIANKKGA